MAGAFEVGDGHPVHAAHISQLLLSEAAFIPQGFDVVGEGQLQLKHFSCFEFIVHNVALMP